MAGMICIEPGRGVQPLLSGGSLSVSMELTFLSLPYII